MNTVKVAVKTAMPFDRLHAKPKLQRRVVATQLERQLQPVHIIIYGMKGPDTHARTQARTAFGLPRELAILPAAAVQQVHVPPPALCARCAYSCFCRCPIDLN